MDCTSFDDLPDGLVLDILSRLPVKILIQSTCVCKLWYSIIKTPSFVSSHLSRSISDPSSYYIYLFRCNSPSMIVISDNHLLTRHPDLVFPSEIKYASLELIGTCNGLVCATDYSRDIYLINPFIHKHKNLVLDSSCDADWIKKFHCARERVDIKVGFGYSEVENDYKVVRIFNRYSLREKGSTYKPQVLESKVEIYSLKSGKWRSLDVSIELSSYYPPIFMHGCLYWSVSGPDEYLLCFDLKDEVFSKIEFPTTYLQLDSRLGRNILKRNGSVAVVVYDFDSICPCMWIYIFVLEKNVVGQVQWKELYYERANLNAGKCIGFSGVGRLLFVERNSDYEIKYIVAVDLDNSCAIEKLAMDSNGIVNGATNVLESLVLLSDSPTLIDGKGEQCNMVDKPGENEDNTFNSVVVPVTNPQLNTMNDQVVGGS